MRQSAGVEGFLVLLMPATRRDGEAITSCLEGYQVHCRVSRSIGEIADLIGDQAGLLLITDQVVADPDAYLISQALTRQPTWSDLPVVILSKVGSESWETSDFVRRMTNVTLLDRPTSTRTLLSAVQAALRSRSKQYQMRDQLTALQSAENALRQSDRRKDEFLAMLAHELRNPLAPIRSAIDLLPRLIAANDQRTHSTVAVIDRQVLQLTRLVDDLLDVSRITQGRIEIKRSTINLATVLNQALESVQPLMNEKHHTVSCTAAPNIFVEGDSARLVQCVSNVLINAAKYTDPGGTIRVSLQGDQQRACIAISDSGVGIPAELLPRVFELFVQDTRSLDRSQGGLGIGLSVVRNLIEMHGGEVRAASTGAGKGATFEIVLPQVPAPADAPSAEAPGPMEAALKVLVVDDNADAADSLAMLLSLEGHEVKSVYDPMDALSVTSSFSPHLILLDIGLPGIDGYEVARRLRATGVRARLVALTGYGQRQDQAHAVMAGFDGHLVKPVQWDQLEAVLHSIAP